MNKLNLPFNEWGKWRKSDKSSAHLNYYCPLGREAANDVNQDILCNVEKGYSKLEKIDKKTAKAISIKYVQKLPWLAACAKLKESKNQYFSRIKEGEAFIAGVAL